MDRARSPGAIPRRLDGVERVQVEAGDAGLRIGAQRRDPFDEAGRLVEAAGVHQTGQNRKFLARKRWASLTPIRAAIVEQLLRSATPGTPTSTARSIPSPRRRADPCCDRTSCRSPSASSHGRRRPSRGAPLAARHPGCQHGPSDSRATDRPRTGAPNRHRGQEDRPSRYITRLVPSPPTTNAFGHPRLAARSSSRQLRPVPDHPGREVRDHPEAVGLQPTGQSTSHRCPSPATPSPTPGRRAAGAAIWSGRLLSGSSSKIGSARRRVRTAARGRVEPGAAEHGHQTSESGIDALRAR